MGPKNKIQKNDAYYCSKCKGHGKVESDRTAKCFEDWKEPKDQECDNMPFCDPKQGQHEVGDCQATLKLQIPTHGICKTCGHANGHDNSKDCPIGNGKKPAHLKQWTQKKQDEWKKAKASKSAVSQDSGQPSASNQNQSSNASQPSGSKQKEGPKEDDVYDESQPDSFRKFWCSKCKRQVDVNHRSKCDKDCKFKFHGEQQCDNYPYCIRSGDSQHEVKDCPVPNAPGKYGANTEICTRCGHRNSHKDGKCNIGDGKNPEHLKQWTKSKWDDWQAKHTGIRATAVQDQAELNKKIRAMQITVKPAPDGPEILTKRQDEKLRARSNLQLTPAQTVSEGTRNHVLDANFLSVKISNNGPDIRKYRIELGKINGKTPSKRETRRALIEQLLAQRPPGTEYATDYFSYIVSVGKLYSEFNDDALAATDAYSVRHIRSGRPGDLYPVVDTYVHYEGRFDVAGLRNYIDPNSARDPNYFPDEDLRILNIISWGKILHTQFQGGRVGNKFFPDEQREKYSGQLFEGGSLVYNIRTGFFTSMRPGINKLLLNVNSATSAFYAPGNFQHWLFARGGMKGRKKLEQLSYELKNKIRVTFEGDKGAVTGKKRVVRLIDPTRFVSDVEFDKPVNSNNPDGATFKCSVHKHMEDQYPFLKPFNPNAFCVSLGKTEKGEMWYPADKLHIVDWQPVPHTLKGSHGETMILKAARFPHENRDLIKDIAFPYLDLDRGADRTIYDAFGLEPAATFVEVKPLVLEPPSLLYKDDAPGGEEKRRGKASWGMTDVKKGLHIAKNTLPKLHIIRIGWKGDTRDDQWLYELPQDNRVDKSSFIEQLLNDLSRYGLTQLKPSSRQVTFTKNHIYLDDVPKDNNPKDKNSKDFDAIQHRHYWAGQLDKIRKDQNEANLFFILLPRRADNNDEIYADIKWWGDCKVGAQTICLKPIENRYKDQDDLQVGKRGPSANLRGNLALKINAKLGGTNHRVNFGGLMKTSTMVVGADVSHAGKVRDETCPSMSGVVATWDDNFAQYLPSARLQEHNQEYIENLKEMLVERLNTYRERNRKLPSHILFYRDGVSESQYGMVRDKELPQIRDACRIAGAPKINITLIVVGKRHHARFYPREAGDPMAKGSDDIAGKDQKSGQCQSCRAGIVIDTDVIVPKQFNFYLQSHDSFVGTAKPGHYVVIENESGYSGKDLQEVTNKLCFMGSRATHGLSYCTPARYADILCNRLRTYMKPVLDNHMVDVLSGDIDNYAQNSDVWGLDRGGKLGRKNPWHPKVDGTMFYL